MALTARQLGAPARQRARTSTRCRCAGSHAAPAMSFSVVLARRGCATRAPPRASPISGTLGSALCLADAGHIVTRGRAQADVCQRGVLLFVDVDGDAPLLRRRHGTHHLPVWFQGQRSDLPRVRRGFRMRRPPRRGDDASVRRICAASPRSPRRWAPIASRQRSCREWSEHEDVGGHRAHTGSACRRLPLVRRGRTGLGAGAVRGRSARSRWAVRMRRGSPATYAPHTIRGFAGLHSHRATTTARVIENPGFTRDDLVLALEASLGDGGWPSNGRRMSLTRCSSSRAGGPPAP